jgi:mannose-6-phosphate isomerase-like protein (cupin superfamily)
MIIKSNDVPISEAGRKPYSIGDREILVKHFVTRVTHPDNPFGPHDHEQAELWYILDGIALVKLGDAEHQATAGDLIVIDPWVEHGLRTEGEATWICLG